MNKKEKEAYSYFIQSYQRLKDLNEPYREKFDRYDELYRGYRDDTKYPFAYNYSFNKIIPVIYTVLSRVMSHLYRDSEVVVVKPQRSADIQRADRAAGVLNHQLNNLNSVDFQGGSYMVMFQWFLSAMIHGKGIVKTYWRKEERTVPRRMDILQPNIVNSNMGLYLDGFKRQEVWTESPQVIYNGPYIENIPVRQFLPDPEYRSIQDMPVCGHVYKKSMDWLREMEAKGFYKNIKKIGKTAKMVKDGSGSTDITSFDQVFQTIESAYTIDEIESSRHKARNIEIIDLYGKYALNDGRTYIGEGITLKGQESEVICTIANHDTIIHLDRIPYGVKPFFDVGAHINPHRYWDIGMIELVADVQDAYNNMANLRVHNSMMKVNTMIKVLTDADIDPRSLVWKPFGIIPVEDMGDVEVLDTPDYTSHLFNEQIGFFESAIQDMTGIYDYAKGVTPDRQEHVGTISSLQAVAESRIKLLLLTMDYMGIRPLLKYMMMLNTHHLPSGYEYRIMGRTENQFQRVWGEDLHIEYDFEAKYAAMEPQLIKEARIQSLLQYSQMWQEDPYVNQYEFKKAVLELMDMVNPDRFLKNPQQVQQEQQQRLEQQMKFEMAKLNVPKEVQASKNQGDIAKALLK